MQHKYSSTNLHCILFICMNWPFKGDEKKKKKSN